MKLQLFFWMLLLVTGCNQNKQNKTLSLLAKLNSIYKERDLFKGRIPNIIFDTLTNNMVIGNDSIPLSKCKVYYERKYNKEYKKYFHLVTFYCANNDTCIINIKSKESSYGVGFPFKSKAVSLEFIDLVKKLSISGQHNN